LQVQLSDCVIVIYYFVLFFLSNLQLPAKSYRLPNKTYRLPIVA